MNHRYFMVTSKYEYYNYYHYKSGFNVVLNFERKNKNTGFIFTDKHRIHNFYGNGIFISPIILPYSDSDFCMASVSLSWRSNKIILGEKHKLAKIETFHKFNIKFPTLLQILCSAYKYIEDESQNAEQPISCIIKYLLEKKYYHPYISNPKINWYIENKYWNIVRNEHWNLIKNLIQRNIVNKEKNIFLTLAIKCGDLQMLVYLLKSGLQIDLSHALIMTAERGYLNILKYLISKGANINAFNSLPLIYSAKNGHLDVVSYLCKNGANIHAYDDAAYHQSYINNQLHIIKYFKSF